MNSFSFFLSVKLYLSFKFEGQPCQVEYSWFQVFFLSSSWAGSPGWGDWGGVWTPCSLGSMSAIMMIFPFMDHLPGGVGLDYTVSLPLLPISLWLLFYILSCGKSFLVVFSPFSQIVALKIVLNSCNYGVPIGGGEFRVFLLSHLGHTLT